MQGTAGNFHGTTYDGGSVNNAHGTVFQITPGGALTTLHTFTETDGDEPNGSLVQASEGNFYGVTSLGGAHSVGTVFQVTSTGMLKTIYSFGSSPNGADGCTPNGGLVQGPDGRLYGTTRNGGGYGYGEILPFPPAVCSRFCTDFV